ncbi:MAG: glycoside hydrolase family 3 N-terminal domain-containing protein [Ancalomicrobiaceae bacterium]|nr:glycoside hydrolase family 3 N-terminal domain-containing protein [Ancalomicrobiaceae bacterium]
MSRIDDLLSRMTLDEKIGQLVMQALGAGTIVTGPGAATDSSVDDVRQGRIGSILNLVGRDRILALQKIAVEETRLGIPLLVGLDVIHGYLTDAPVPLAETAAFRPDLWEETARMAAEEAAEDGVHLTFAPMLDLARDPRWGRMVEGPGEDPYVGRVMAAAKTAGFQGRDLTDPLSIGATAKHFVAYGAVNAGREYASVEVSDRTLHEFYLPAFKAAVDAGTVAIMPAFHDIAGRPMSGDKALLTGLVRDTWGFDGIYVSDYDAIGELVAHGVAADMAEAAAIGLEAGMDIDMMSAAYREGLKPAIERGLVSVDLLDATVRRVLAVKERLGLFDNPYARGTIAVARPRQERRALVRAVGAASCVLLKNDDAVLPLAPTGGRIALIGPFATTKREMIGAWYGLGDREEAVTIEAGVRAGFPHREVVVVEGVSGLGTETDGIAEAVAAAGEADLVLLAVGEAAELSGEAASRVRPGFTGRQAELVSAVIATGKPVVILLVCGRPLIETEAFAAAAAVLVIWHPGSEGGAAVAEVLSGRRPPSGKLPVSWPSHLGQVPIFYAQRNTGRPYAEGEFFVTKYVDASNEPLYPFGYGLSYTTFELGEPIVEATRFKPGETVNVTVRLANTGPVSADTTVFLFSHDCVASTARPILELKRFQTVTLAAGEETFLHFDLEPADFECLGPDLVPRAEPGDFVLSVGFSADRRLVKTVRVTLGD